MDTATGAPVTVTRACSQKHVPERTVSSPFAIDARVKAHPRRCVRFDDEPTVRCRGTARLFETSATRMQQIENATDAPVSEVCGWLRAGVRVSVKNKICLQVRGVYNV